VAEIGQQAVADRLGYSRPAISLALSGHYPGSTDRLAARIERIYGNPQVLCPHFQTLIPLADCEAHQQRPYNPANADRLRLYLACRRCPLAAAPPEAINE
jgi:hypothetical protein